VSWPPPYPRIPHLPPAPAATRDDLTLDNTTAQDLLSRDVVVEEKLDGASVMLWMDGGRVEVATRGGPGAQDRAGQLGPLRAWTARRAEQLGILLAGDRVLYAEWMWLTHSVAYDSLPDHLIGLDLYSGAGFAPIGERDAAFSGAAVAPPPRIFEGILGRRERVDELLGGSRFGRGAAEGLIIRSTGAGDERRLAKVVLASLTRRSDASWRRIRERNALTP
jgi:hypothetical protein